MLYTYIVLKELKNLFHLKTFYSRLDLSSNSEHNENLFFNSLQKYRAYSVYVVATSLMTSRLHEGSRYLFWLWSKIFIRSFIYPDEFTKGVEGRGGVIWVEEEVDIYAYLDISTVMKIIIEAIFRSQSKYLPS